MKTVFTRGFETAGSFSAHNRPQLGLFGFDFPDFHLPAFPGGLPPAPAPAAPAAPAPGPVMPAPAPAPSYYPYPYPSPYPNPAPPVRTAYQTTTPTPTPAQGVTPAESTGIPPAVYVVGGALLVLGAIAMLAR